MQVSLISNYLFCTAENQELYCTAENIQLYLQNTEKSLSDSVYIRHAVHVRPRWVIYFHILITGTVLNKYDDDLRHYLYTYLQSENNDDISYFLYACYCTLGHYKC